MMLLNTGIAPIVEPVINFCQFPNISRTAVKIPDILKFSRQVAPLHNNNK